MGFVFIEIEMNFTSDIMVGGFPVTTVDDCQIIQRHIGGIVQWLEKYRILINL